MGVKPTFVSSGPMSFNAVFDTNPRDLSLKKSTAEEPICETMEFDFSAADAVHVAIAPAEKTVIADNAVAMILVLILLVFFMVFTPFVFFVVLVLFVRLVLVVGIMFVFFMVISPFVFCLSLLWFYYIRVTFASSLQISLILKKVSNFFEIFFSAWVGFVFPLTVTKVYQTDLCKFFANIRDF